VWVTQHFNDTWWCFNNAPGKNHAECFYPEGRFNLASEAEAQLWCDILNAREDTDAVGSAGSV